MSVTSNTPTRANSRVNYSNEIHDLSTVQDGAPSLAPSMYYQEKSFADFFPPHLGKKVISEVVATFLLVFVTCGAASIYSADVTRVSQLGQSVVGGLIVTVMIYATGHISGAHMNPAVTLSFACFRHFPWIQVRAVLLGGAVHGGDVRGVRAAGGAAPDHGAGDDDADGAALARARHRDHRHLQHDVHHLRRRHGLEGGG
ncbi:unnamed protein product [Triticum turgidum subsp. durum]|uniref:Uncharacterized protein n=1 Tax=Triticum turgidum subsp. durum TaxID=4567 RepID=A0A9R0ZWB9_TRITD|nr:unnamed protein product [Triticum turgidum subsp. durum]